MKKTPLARLQYLKDYWKSLKQRPQQWARCVARRQAHNALRRGRIAKQPCERCGFDKAEMHHADYSNPLEITWLCKSCHKFVHKFRNGEGVTANGNRWQAQVRHEGRMLYLGLFKSREEAAKTVLEKRKALGHSMI